MIILVLVTLLSLVGCGALYFISESRRSFDKSETTTVYPFRKFMFAPLAIPLVVLLFESFTIVPAGHMGVQVTMGTVNPVALDAGVHFVNPISQVRVVEVRLQRATMEGASASTKDMQQVHTDITTNYRLSGEKVAAIYKDFGLNVTDKVLAPSINEAFKSVTAHYTSEELITKRDEVSSAILQRVKEKVAQFDITIDSVSLVNFGFSPDYQKAIEQKVIATQQKQKAEQDLERIKVEAASRIAQAEGEAKAIAIQAQAIQSNGGAQYVQLQAIEKWDGKLPSTMLGNSTPFINVGK
jgi:regulator of protease activity HflC (stomatin/prohibitin superfamily)